MRSSFPFASSLLFRRYGVKMTADKCEYLANFLILWYIKVSCYRFLYAGGAFYDYCQQ